MTVLRPAERSSLAETIELQRAGCELAGSDLYSRILAVIAADLDDGGPCGDLLAPHAVAPVGDAVLLRFLAGVHGLVLAGAAPDLATYYPSAGGAVDGTGGAARAGGVVSLGEAFTRVVAENGAELVAAMQRNVQTNEVGRSVALLCGFLEAARSGMPLRVLEVGASAGLNLLFDRYLYRSGDWSFGIPDSPVVFDRPFRGRPPAVAGTLEVIDRLGCDVQPIDPSSPEGALRLRSFVWPDQLDRLARLDAALAVAATCPVRVDQDDAVTWLRRELAEQVPGVATVVSHSIVFQYLSVADRRGMLSALDEAGAGASERSPLMWLRMEPGGDRAEVRLTRWPGGDTRTIARSSYHGPPVSLTVSASR